MQVALPFEEAKQRTMVPKQVIGLAAALLTGTAVTPMNMIAAQEVSTSFQTKIVNDSRIVNTASQSAANIKIMEEKAGNESFSCVNVKNIALMDAKKEAKGMRDKITTSVLSWNGIAYKWGGRSRAGVDCSGLVQRIFIENGIQLPRTSFEQFKVGVGIPKERLEPGDLVFFNTNGAGASHVGIYLGDGQFISATKDCVEIQSLQDPYWAKTYRGSRRVIGTSVIG